MRLYHTRQPGLTLILITIFFFTPVNTFAADEDAVSHLSGAVSGILSGKVIISDDVIIEQNQRVLIEPGTRILISQGVRITVRGSITAQGQADKPVFFDALEWQYDKPGRVIQGRWDQIRVLSGARLEFRNVAIGKCRIGIAVDSLAEYIGLDSVRFTDCEIDDVILGARDVSTNKDGVLYGFMYSTIDQMSIGKSLSVVSTVSPLFRQHDPHASVTGAIVSALLIATGYTISYVNFMNWREARHELHLISSAAPDEKVKVRLNQLENKMEALETSVLIGNTLVGAGSVALMVTFPFALWTR